MEGYPAGLRAKINNSLKCLSGKYSVDFQVPIYWNSEFEEGIKLSSGGYRTTNLLHKVGKVVYNRY